VCHALAKCHTVAATGQDHAAVATLHELGLPADAQSQCQQASLQALAAVHPDQAHALTDSHINQGNYSRHLWAHPK